MLEGRVLLVDDDELLRKSLRRLLTRSGLTVRDAASPSEAAEALMEESFDSVITDIHMSEGGGLAVLRTARRVAQDVPVLLLTGCPDVDTAVAAVNQGALRYLVKPVDPDELLGELRRGIGLYRVAQARRKLDELIASRPQPTPQLSAALNQALDHLWIAYQPLVDTEGRPAGFEALMRSAVSELPHPGAILEAGEVLGRIEEIGRQVRQLAVGPLVGAVEGPLLFVNLHPRELLDEQLYRADGPLAEHARRVVLEVTERTALDSIPDASSRIRRLHELGYRIALDDLGAGFAGLSSFAVLEPHVVKLDRSLIAGIDGSPTRQQLVGSMTQLCRDLGILVVAEGIERPEEWETARALGCDLFQGYLFARPAPWTEVAEEKEFRP